MGEAEKRRKVWLALLTAVSVFFAWFALSRLASVALAVPAPCAVSAPARPAWAVDGLPLGAGIWAQMRALRVEREQRRGYELELEAVARGCAAAPGG